MLLLETRSTSRLFSTLDILPLFYLRQLTFVAKNASVEINPQGIVRVYCVLYAKDSVDVVAVHLTGHPTTIFGKISVRKTI